MKSPRWHRYAERSFTAIVAAAAFNQDAEDMMKKSKIDTVEKVQGFMAFMACDLADALEAEVMKREKGGRAK